MSKQVDIRACLQDGSVEALKWFALVFMTGDHINKYLFNGTLPVLFEAGRIALPLFVCVMAYNLARPGSMEKGAHWRTIKRLAVFGIIATPAFVALGCLKAGWWPLNVMFTLLISASAICLFEQGKFGAGVLTASLGGSFVEFWWPSIALCIAMHAYFKRPTWLALAAGILCCAFLCSINGNLWAFCAAPLFLAASRFDFRVPRLKWLFYAYYPLHLVVLLIIRTKMSEAGYFFAY